MGLLKALISKGFNGTVFSLNTASVATHYDWRRAWIPDTQQLRYWSLRLHFEQFAEVHSHVFLSSVTDQTELLNSHDLVLCYLWHYLQRRRQYITNKKQTVIIQTLNRNQDWLFSLFRCHQKILNWNPHSSLVGMDIRTEITTAII